jgi:hypothetical protein
MLGCCGVRDVGEKEITKATDLARVDQKKNYEAGFFTTGNIHFLPLLTIWRNTYPPKIRKPPMAAGFLISD